MREEVCVRRSQDVGAKSPSNVVTGGPWTPRDAYIAETAVTLDRLTAKIERLERQEEALAKRVAELTEHAQQAGRFQALAESLRNSRDYKLDEVFRLVKDVRARVEAMEGPRTEFNALTHKTFSSIDRKLAELSAGQAREADRAGQLQPGSVAIGFLAAAVAVSFLGLVF
jgi:phage shock protein A